MANKYLLNKPSSAFDINSQMMRGWFNDVDVFTRRLSDITATKTADFTVQDALFYPVDSTAGAIVVNLPASLGNRGRQVVFKQIAGSNTVTITPSGSDTIGGAATLVLTSNSVVHYIADGGTDWIDISQGGSGVNSQVFTASGTFTWPSGVDAVRVTLVGGGGGGGRSNSGSNASAGGGGSGEIIYRREIQRFGATTTSVTVGSAGVGATANSTAGGNGTASVFGNISADFGRGGGFGGAAGGAGGGTGGGAGGAAGNPPSAGTTGTVGGFDHYGGGGGGGGANAASNTGGAGAKWEEQAGGLGGANGGAASGGGGGAAGFNAPGANGGAGVAGGTGATGSTGTANSGAGGGAGGAGTTTGNGGNGGSGIVIIEWD